jgi:hypothetical protein
MGSWSVSRRSSLKAEYRIGFDTHRIHSDTLQSEPLLVLGQETDWPLSDFVNKSIDLCEGRPDRHDRFTNGMALAVR